MSDAYRDLMRAYADATAPTEAEISHLRASLEALVIDADSSRALLSHLPEPRPAEIVELKRRVRLGRPPEKRNPWLWVGGAAGTLALAAAFLLVVGAALIAAMQLSADRAVQTELAAVSEPTLTAPAPGVALRYAGSGSVRGTEQAPVVDWKTGAVEVSVEPGAGIALSVETREARVFVIGTVFTVDRDALGTRVDVERGKVGVDCTTGDSHVLTAGQTVTCLPTSAAGLLGRAVALEERGAVPDAVLEATDAALRHAPAPPLEHEIRATRMRALTEMGRNDEALDEIELLVQVDGPRRIELLVAGATLALNEADCDRARPWIEALREAGALPKALGARARSCR